MLLVVADTGPLRYRVEIDHIGLLPHLFEKVFIPSVVYDELRHPAAPGSVRLWADSQPAWLKVLPDTPSNDPALKTLDAGERSALTLGTALGADLILIDDRKAGAAALRKGFQVIGTLGLLARAAQLGLLDLAAALMQLKNTNFRYRQELFDEVLNQYLRRDDP